MSKNEAETTPIEAFAFEASRSQVLALLVRFMAIHVADMAWSLLSPYGNFTLIWSLGLPAKPSLMQDKQSFIFYVLILFVTHPYIDSGVSATSSYIFHPGFPTLGTPCRARWAYCAEPLRSGYCSILIRLRFRLALPPGPYPEPFS